MPRCARCFGEIHKLAVFCPSCNQPHQPAFDQLFNQVVGERYQVYRRLGQGGLSAVFTALDQQTDQVVVLKFSDPSHLTKRELTYALDAEEARRYWAEMLERMRREAEALAPIRHPHIVQLYDTGTLTQDLRYVVMEYLRGHSLREELATRHKLPLAEALNHAITLADALREIHARGIVHRDLNPRNVMLCQAEPPAETTPVRHPSTDLLKLIDFGIARFPQLPGDPPFTQHSILSGTVAYASPEQCQNLPLDQRTDLYSLGVMLYEMLAGGRPFAGRTPTEIALKQIQQAPQPPRELVPELPLSLEATLLRLLAKNPVDRHANVVELADELRAIAARVVVELPENSAVESVEPKTAGLRPPAKPIEAKPFEVKAVEASTAGFLHSYTQTSGTRRRAVAYSLLALVLLTGGVLLAKGKWASLPPSSVLLVEKPLAVSDSPATTTTTLGNPLSAMVTAPRTEPDGAQEPLLAAPEAQMALATGAAAKPVAPAPAAKPGPQIAAKPTAPPIVRTSVNPVFTPLPAPVPREPAIFSLPESLPPPSGSTTPTNTVENNWPARRRAGRELPEMVDVAGSVNQPATKAESSGQANSVEETTTEQPRHTPPADFAPRVISWSGSVRGERVVRLEMPGVPGLVEIPRSYRHRVGIIEPPSLENRWRLVALRILGRGEVSIILRWWPK